jgi:hypothetical protein
MSGSPHWSLSLRFPHQNPVQTSPIPHTSLVTISNFNDCSLKSLNVHVRKIHTRQHIKIK